MKKLRVFESLKYLHVYISANENEENENWEGRMRYMETKLIRALKGLKTNWFKINHQLKIKYLQLKIR